MKTPKINRYRLAISRTFPATHPKKGKQTWFTDKILLTLEKFKACTIFDYENDEKIIVWHKIHTIRSNYPLWEKRMAEVQAGRAVIELFYWSGKPYNSPQVVFATLDKDSGCGVQRISMASDLFCASIATSYSENLVIGLEVINSGDGLSLEDFKAWFKGYDLHKPLAIIHFTSFRY